MKLKNLMGVMAGGLLLCLCISVAPVHAVEQGDTIYIGDTGLNLTHALNDAQGSPLDGVPPLTNVGWWASGSNPPDAPGYILNLAGNYQNFYVSPITFQGYTGKYYVVNASGQPAGPYAFNVQYPSPTADFTSDTTSGPVPLTVQFTDTSTGFPTGWAWFFGDEDYTETWTEQSASAGWTAGPGSDGAVLPDGSIVLVRNGVWRSTDQGISWTQVNPSPPFSDGDTVAMPDGTMLHMNYMGAGWHTGILWKSTDKGSTWTWVNMTTSWDSGSQYTNLEDCVVLPDGTILLTIYHAMAGEWTALMRSTDQGITWTGIGSIAWSPRTHFDLAAMPDGSTIATGGYNWTDTYNDVWRSTDKGTTWIQQTANAGWTPRYDHTSVAMPDGSIVLMGGYGSSIPGRDEVWRSTDNGATWTLLTSNADWPARTGATSVAMPDGSIVLMGGEQTPGFGPYNDVWRLVPTGSSVQNPSHTYNTTGTYQVALQIYNDAGYGSVRKPAYITAEPPGRAEAIANGNSYLGQNPQTIGEEELLVSDQELPPATGLMLLNGTTIISPAGSSTWVEFIDLAKNDNWGHPAKLVFYANGQVIQEYDVDFPPSEENIVKFLHEGGNFPNYEGRTTIGIDPDPDYACRPDASHNYAVLISGGGDSSQNYARYYNDIKFLYKTLIGPNYGYSPSHIKVVMSDGSQDARADQKTSTSTINSDPKLDGTNSVNILRATKANVTSAIRDWTPVLTSADTLFIFTSGHGEKTTTNADPNTNDVNLLLWGTEKISDTELVNALPANPKVLMMMEQCYGGGFKDEFIPSSGTTTRVLATAAKGNEASHSNDYSYYWITAAAGQDSAATPILVDADKNPVNGQVSGREAHTFAFNLDPSRIAGVETPQFFEWTANPAAGSSTYAGACVAQQSITVTVPAGTWAAGTAKTITWNYAGFATTPTVKIELWNSTNWQADIKTSIAANIKTFTWKLPLTLPGGSQSSYFVKISTIGTSQLVSGQSSAFSVSGVRTQWPGALYVTSSPTGATIILKDLSYNPVKIGGVEQSGQITNKNWSSISPGRYWVKVTKSCYQDVSFAQKQVNPNATTSAPFALVEIPAASCINGINTGPTGSIAIYSLPQEGFRVFLRGGPAGGTLDSPEYIDMGYETPVIQDLGAGDYMVKLVADGFVSQEQPVTVNAGEQESVYFVLSQDTEWYTFSGFDAPIEMSTSINSIFNTAKAGNNIPLKWHLSDRSGYIDDPAKFTLKFDKISCPGKKVITHDIEVLDTAASTSGLSYLGNGSWHYNWKTTKGDTKCYNVYLEFVNNGLSSPVAKFQLK